MEIGFERLTGVEPASSAWEADILPMYYACKKVAVQSGNSLLQKPPLYYTGMRRKIQDVKLNICISGIRSKVNA